MLTLMERLGAAKFKQSHLIPVPWSRCPECDHGVVGSAPKVTIFVPPALERALRAQTAPPDDEAGHYNAQVTCQHCKTIIQAAGTWFTDVDFDDDGQWHYVRYYRPAWMSHYPSLVRVADSVPDSIRGALVRADMLFWVDTSSCATALRQSIEVFLDRHQIARHKLTAKGRRNFRRLEERTQEFVAAVRAKSPEISQTYEQLLVAARHLANEGAHAKRPFPAKKIALVAGLVERVLSARYPASDAILAVAKRIHARRTRRNAGGLPGAGKTR